MQYTLNYSGTRLCPLRIKITQFPNGLCQVNLEDITLELNNYLLLALAKSIYYQ